MSLELTPQLSGIALSNPSEEAIFLVAGSSLLIGSCYIDASHGDVVFLGLSGELICIGLS